MDLRLDRVIRRGAAGDQRVYSLLLADEGLYLFHTGEVGGLIPDESTPKPARLIVDETTLPFIAQLIKNEARVKSLPPEYLIEEDGNDLVHFESIMDVQTNLVPEHSRLRFETKQDRFEFVFTAVAGDLHNVARFFDSLTKRIESA